ncbi:heparin-binding EGF-like growth factor a [Megalops cyprinoides]|uniref:heparin-binding EGF-like growth factor a n=1 Tax=Megalops cyprinoides TaxID=118141 RepID=UPI001864A761|nr:heparin-binding EGF-like growth factor a [Megalops cyprinoides]
MKIFRMALLFIHAFALSRLAGGASIDRIESEKPSQTAVINLLEGLTEIRSAEANTEVQYDGEDDDYYYDDDEEEDEDYLSGDYEIELPKVAFSSKPQDPSVVLTAERTEGGKRRKGKGRKKGKGKGKKRNPCLRKYKDFCIHGTCQYLKDLRTPSCICQPDYSGERCHLVSLRTRTSGDSYSRTTALAVVAVVLSSLCLTVIGILLALRYHRRGAYDVENEEKVKLGTEPHH